jgi:hypothetical protein
MFSDMPDLTANLLRSSVSEKEAWTEWHWQGSFANGTRFNMRGVIIFGLDSGTPTKFCGAGCIWSRYARSLK